MDLETISKTNTTATEGPEQAVARFFSRCSNCPKDPLGIAGLAQGLSNACEKTGIDPVELCKHCADLSEYCPTNFDLLTVAREMYAERRRTQNDEEERLKIAEWKRVCGDPAPFECEADFWQTAKANIAKREVMEKHIHTELKKLKPQYKDRQNIPISIWFRMQNQLGYEFTPEQRKYL